MSNTYKVVSNLNHDNVEYPKGSKIELDNATAKGLIEDGVIESLDTAEPTPTPVASSRLDKNKKDEKPAETKADENKGAENKEVVEDGLEALTVPKLLKLANDEEVEIEAGTTKPNIIEAIRAARIAKADENKDSDDNL